MTWLERFQAPCPLPCGRLHVSPEEGEQPRKVGAETGDEQSQPCVFKKIVFSLSLHFLGETCADSAKIDQIPSKSQH